MYIKTICISRIQESRINGLCIKCYTKYVKMSENMKKQQKDRCFIYGTLCSKW